MSDAGNGSPPGAAEPRERILAAAATAIARHGFHGMSMRELARGAGMSLSNLYNYFASKDEILDAIQKGAFEVLVRSVEAALERVAREGANGSAGADARLYVFVSHHVHYVAANPDVMRVLVHEATSLPAARRGEVRRLKERYFRIAREIVTDLVHGGCCRAGEAAAAAGRGKRRDELELDRVTYNLFGMLNWIYGWYDPEVHGEPRELSRTIHRIALCGIVTQCPYRELQEGLDYRLASVALPSLLSPTSRTADPGGSAP